MSAIRVLIVDDSVVVRKVLCEALNSDPSIEVAGTAPSGNIALAKIPQLNPDVITLDIEMPGLNGLETLAQIRKLYPNISVIMCSTLTERGAAVTLEALAVGASDYVTKPSNSESLSAAKEQIRRELVEKIVSLAHRFSKSSPVFASAPVPRRRSAPAKIEILAIGTSTGGPNALGEVIPTIPGDFPVPIVVVQHMPPVFTRLLAERLDSRSPLSVREAEPGAQLQPGTVWIARGDYHMMVQRKDKGVVLQLTQDTPENSCRPAVDPLFRSAAATYGPRVLGVVMTGMGADGTRGAKSIRDAGGEILIQDEASSVVWGMPGSIASAGLADEICPLQEIGPAIIRRVRPHALAASIPSSRRV